MICAATGFTGNERDVETGLDYFGARYFSAAEGRFTSPDEFPGGIVDPFTGQQVGQPGPLPYADITDPQTLNKYAYVRNNPLRYVDPDGHAGESVVDDVLDFAIVQIRYAGQTVATGASRGLGLLGNLFGAGAMVLTNAGLTQQDEIKWLNEQKQRQQQQPQQASTDAPKPNEPEPEAAAGGGRCPEWWREDGTKDQCGSSGQCGRSVCGSQKGL